MAIAYNNIGECYNLLGQTEQAITYFKEALNLRRKYNNNLGLVGTLNNIGHFYLNSQKYDSASMYLEEAAILVHKIDAKELLRDNLKHRMELATAKNDFKKAYFLSLEHTAIKDSILNKEKTKSLYELQTKYETEKKEQENKTQLAQLNYQRAQLDNRETWIYTLISAILVTLIYAFIIRKNFLRLKKAKQKIQFLHRELNHRVKNNLQILSSIFSLQAEHFNDAQIVEAIKSGESRVNAMALIHQKLYLDEAVQEVNLKAYVSELVNYLIKIYGFHTKELNLDMDLEDMEISVDKAIPIGLIINELVSNALKHAFKDNPDPLLQIMVSRNAEGNFALKISDNGKPKGKIPPEEKKSKPSFGLKMVKILVQQLNGHMEESNDAGQHYNLQFN